MFNRKRIKQLEEEEKWKRHFQKFCDSDEIREESKLNGIQCDYCRGSHIENACAKSMIEYCDENGIKIDFRDISKCSFRKLLKGENNE